MKAYRIYITGWTASFRFPNLISGFQPTLPVPPLSTIWGLISAAKGEWIYPSGKKLGFVFSYQAKDCDPVETVYQFEPKNIAKSNIIRREFLVDNELWIYTEQEEIAKAFIRPYFPLVLGRSGDLATVKEVSEVDLEETQSLHDLKGTIVPLDCNVLIPSPMQALPVFFSPSFPRKARKVKPFFILDGNYSHPKPFALNGAIDHEPNNTKTIYWHKD